MWGGFACFWEFGVITSGAPFFFMLWGIPFVLMGLYVTVGRFFVDARQRANTYYGLTNERVIILSGLFNRNIKSLNLGTLAQIDITQHNDGRGTITFGPSHPMVAWSSASWPSGNRYAPPSFEMIEDAKEVYRQIMQAQKK